MMRNVAELGHGKLWAIHEAQQIAGFSLEGGLRACDTHLEVGAEASVIAIPRSELTTHARSCARFIVDTQALIGCWEESDGQVLPQQHFDFGYDLRPRALKIGASYLFHVDYDPMKLSADAAVNHFRVVRLALPEILRRHKPTVAEAGQSGLDKVKSSLDDAVKRMPERAKHANRPVGHQPWWA